jgi:hypothetical protein
LILRLLNSTRILTIEAAKRMVEVKGVITC